MDEKLLLLICALSLTWVLTVDASHNPAQDKHKLKIAIENTNGVNRLNHNVKNEGMANQVAWVIYENKINQTGWAFLEVYTSGSYSNDMQAYYAGWLEGYATRDLIEMQWINIGGDPCTKQPQGKLCKQLTGYINTNLQWVQMMIQNNPKDPYWEQVKLFYYQVSGLIDGYRNQTGKPRFQVDVPSLFFMQIGGDLGAIQSSFSHKSDVRLTEDGHCSALIKLLPGFADLYTSQDTWTEFQQMLRILKKYNFEFYLTSASKEFIPVGTMTFSSYPGMLTSGDDFYVMSNGMVSMETTIGNGNPDRWKYVTPKNTVIEGIRSMVANRLALSGKEWTALFSQYNSGTYNNQWMIVDYNKFQPGKKPQPGLFYLLEQIPGLIVSKDMTDLLISQTYFGSYNTPYFPEIFNASGGTASVKKFGDWFTYEHTPRANIFRRDHVKVNDLTSMTKLMRYNNFKEDPLSRCNCTPPYSGENGISARSDLNPANGTYPFSALGQRAHGGIDMKLTSSSLRKSLDFIAVSSPTYDNLPAFQWSKSDFDKKLPHVGHPDLWNFKPIQTTWGYRND